MNTAARVRQRRRLTPEGVLMPHSLIASQPRIDFGKDCHFTLDGEMPIDCMFKAGKGRTLFCFFNSALKPNVDYTLPVFTWVKFSSFLSGPRLFISDPTMQLSEDLRLGWYLGTSSYPIQEKISAIISMVMSKCGATRVAFVGSSGGGFPSIFYSRAFPNSVAMVNAPATNLRNHHNKKVVDAFCKVANGFKPIDQHPATTDLTEKKPSIRTGKVYVTQNSRDYDYIQSHLQPLLHLYGRHWTGLNFHGDDVEVIVDDWGDGHVTPPTTVMQDLLLSFDSCPGDTFSALRGGDCERGLRCEVAELPGGMFMASVANRIPGKDCAFYLLKNGVRIDTKWYSSSENFIFHIEDETATYRVKAFQKADEERPVVVESPVFKFKVR